MLIRLPTLQKLCANRFRDPSVAAFCQGPPHVERRGKSSVSALNNDDNFYRIAKCVNCAPTRAPPGITRPPPLPGSGPCCAPAFSPDAARVRTELACTPTLEHRSWSFRAIPRVTSWLRHRGSATRSAACGRLPRAGDPRCSICAKPPTFRARPQGSGTSGRSCTRREHGC